MLIGLLCVAVAMSFRFPSMARPSPNLNVQHVHNVRTTKAQRMAKMAIMRSKSSSLNKHGTQKNLFFSSSLF